MPQASIDLDFDLCRQILLRVEDILDRRVRSMPTDYEFYGYSDEIVTYNIRKLHDENVIVAKERIEWHRDMIRCWPVGVGNNGGMFLAAPQGR